MSTLFTKIINGEIPGRFIWQDEDCVSFLTIGPLTDGHALVVPRLEVDKWTDAAPELVTKLMAVAQTIGQAQVSVFGAPRAGLTIAGFEVEHLPCTCSPHTAWRTSTSPRWTTTRSPQPWTPMRKGSVRPSVRQGTRSSSRLPSDFRPLPLGVEWRAFLRIDPSGGPVLSKRG